MIDFETIQVGERCSLELINFTHTEPLFKLTNANRLHLKQWLFWVDHMQSPHDFTNYIEAAQQRFKAGTEVNFVIIWNGKVAGRIGLHGINNKDKIASVGYWIGIDFSGKGIVTAACTALISIGFKKLNLNRIELKCGTGNTKSRSIAERLHFSCEGVMQQGEWLNGEFIDLYSYALLKKDWEKLNME